MSKYMLSSVFNNEKTAQTTITSVVVDHSDGKNVTTVDRFEVTAESNNLKYLYFEFENFTFKHQNATLAYWGRFHNEKLTEMSNSVDGDLNSVFESDSRINLQFMFKERLNMKRFVSFKDAYTQISGLRMAPSEVNNKFTSLENMGHFLPYIFGEKRINRIDIKNNKK